MKDPGTAHRIYLYQTFRGQERSTGGQFARYTDIARWTATFSSVAGYTQRDLAVGVGDAATVMHVGVVSASFFGFFNAPPVLGRYFGPGEDQPPAGEPVAVLSYSMWRTRYGGRPDVLGTKLQIGPTIYSVIGVAPPHPSDIGSLLVYAQSGEIPKSVRDALTKAIQLKQAVLDADRDINDRTQQIDAITQEQGRIREDMKTVATTTPYYERLLTKLNDQESSLEKLQGERNDLIKQRDTRTKDLEDYLNNLTVG